MEMSSKPRVSLTAVFIKDPNDKGFTGFFAEFPQAVAEGKTEKEVQENLFEALSIMLNFNKEELEEEQLLNPNKSEVIKRTFDLELA
jgi:predicted RNase H-like HicB family nuclease